MYLFLAIALPIFVLLIIFSHRRKKKNIQKVCAMSMEEKCRLLEELIRPLGYSYLPAQDVFTSRIDAWQREMGYCSLYDEAALHLHMIFDALPVYFDYQGKTWLLELWKGQYGINTGCEIGLYCADGIVEEKEWKSTLFHAAEDRDMLPLSFTLFRNEEPISKLHERHWWLTVFHLGCFTWPYDLCMRASVAFPNREMATSFAQGLTHAGLPPCDLCCRCNTVTFSFVTLSRTKGLLRRLRIRIAMWMNHFWCKVYLFITRPFQLSMDRILYLYYYLPFAFRRTLCIRKYKKKRRGSQKGGLL